MKDSYHFRKVVISLELLFCEMSSFYLSPFRLKQIVSTNKMINISNNLGTCQLIDSARTHFAK